MSHYTRNVALPKPVCPVCEGRLTWTFPQDYPTDKTVTGRYAHAVLSAAMGNKAMAARVMGLTFRSLQNRLDHPLESKRPMRAEERDAAVAGIESAEPLSPVGSPGGCRGTFNRIAANDLAAVYDIRFNEAVVAIGTGDPMEANDYPNIVFQESDGELRTFSFGEPVLFASLSVVVPVRERHAIVIVVRQGL